MPDIEKKSKYAKNKTTNSPNFERENAAKTAEKKSEN